VEGMVDAAEFWLFIFGILLIVWGILAWYAYYNNDCYVPLWYVLGLLVIGIYNIARSLQPAVSAGVSFATFYNA
jgi:RsiW-degrading membrane proteinase PrsW (M82 family)